MEVFQGEPGLVGPALHQGHHEDHHEHAQDQDGQHRAGQAPGGVPAGVAAQVGVADAVITDVVPLQEAQQEDAHNGGQEHHHRDHRAPVEVGHAAQHLVVEHGGDDLVIPAHRGGNAEVGEAEEEGLDEGAGQGPQQGAEDGDPEGGQGPVPHGLGDHQGLFVHIPHGVVDQQEGHRHRVDHIPHQQAAKAVDVKELVAQQPGDEALLAKGVDDGKAVGDGGQEHG